MTTQTPPPIADTAQTGENIAHDLASLMERMERTRKFLKVEREYIKLVLTGALFVLFGAILTPNFQWRFLLVLGMAITPYLFGWYNLPLFRLANAFRNETLPFLLRDYGRWNYALSGTHFSRDQLKRCGLFNPSDIFGTGNIITGERFGVPLQMASFSVWPKVRFRIYRGKKAMFSGWSANIRLPDALLSRRIILPIGQRPTDPACAGWAAMPLNHSHQIFSPPAETAALPAPLLQRLLAAIADEPKASFAVLDNMLWIFVPTAAPFFNEVTSFEIALNEYAPYEKIKSQLASVFGLLDKLVWPPSA